VIKKVLNVTSRHCQKKVDAFFSVELGDRSCIRTPLLINDERQLILIPNDII
jgi:hypothetical protein